MTQLEAVQKAIEGGYKGSTIQSVINLECLLSADWWQSLGKAMGWKDREHAIHRGHYLCEDEWSVRQHRLLDHIAEGRTIESYFEKL